MSPLYLDLGPYQLRVLHAENGTVPRPRSTSRKRYYRRNELGIVSMNLMDHPLVEIEEGINEIEDGSLVLIWDNDGPELTQADLYRPPLVGFPGKHLNLLSSTVVEVEDDFDVRRDDNSFDIGHAATGTDNASADSSRADDQITGTDEPPPHSSDEADSS